MKIVSVEQMIASEQAANRAGIAYETMMDRAGRGVAEWVLAHLDCRLGVVGLVGSGNNGGDTLIALTGLSARGLRTGAFLVRPREENALVEAYLAQGGVVIDLSAGQSLAYFQAYLDEGAVVLDGMLGTGFRLPLRGALAQVMAEIQSCIQQQPGLQVVAVDCPSGVDCDTGEASPLCLPASHTLTMAAVKQGLLKPPANALAGEIHRIDIGISILAGGPAATLPEMVDRQMAAGILPERPEAGHKGTFGTALILAGSRPYTGAAYLSGKAAYRAGCGLVQMATLPAVQRGLSGRLIEAIWTLLPEKGGGYDRSGAGRLESALNTVQSLALGPGWGLQDENQAFLEALLPLLPPNLPTVIDADGLKLLSKIPHWWEKMPAHSILTPHPGEMATLTGLSTAEIQSQRWEIAQQFAQKWRVVLVLKGALTVIAMPDGRRFVNPVSDSALGTAGSGDVLTGIIGGLLAQGLAQDQTALLGVWLHGQAGQISHQRLGGPQSVTALDILDAVPAAFEATKKAGH